MQYNHRQTRDAFRALGQGFQALRSVRAVQLHQSEAAAGQGAEDAAGAASTGGDAAAREAAAAAANAEAVEKTLPLFLEMIWKVSSVEIMSAVRGAVKKTVKDIAVPEETRLHRAEAVVSTQSTFFFFFFFFFRNVF
eukprot:Filipodium_phascolosomae@DN5410_c0_g1_i2.p1